MKQKKSIRVFQQSPDKWAHYFCKLQYERKRVSFDLGTNIEIEAQKKAKEIYHHLRGNGLKETLKKYKPEALLVPEVPVTVGEFLEAFGRNLKTFGLKQKSYALYCQDLRRVVCDLAELPRLANNNEEHNTLMRPKIDQQPLSILTRAKVYAWRQSYLAERNPDPVEQGRGAIRANQVIHHIRAMFTPERKEVLGISMENPAAGIKALKEPPCQFKPKVDIAELFTKAMGCLDIERKKAFVLLLCAGLRRAEADGRNRYNACKLIGRKLGANDVVLFEEDHAGEDPVEYVIAINIKRRHMTWGQRLDVVDELIKRLPKMSGRPKAEPVMPQSGRDNSSAEAEKLISKTEQTERIAKAAGLSMDAVQTFSHIKNVAPETASEVVAGTKRLRTARKEVRQRTKPKPTPDEHDLAWKRIKEVCEQQFVDMIKEDQVPGLKPVEQLIAFSKLGDKEMQELRQPLYRAHLSLAHARKVLDRRDPVTKVLRPDWTWTHQEMISLMAGDEKQILKRVLETEVGTFVVALARVKPGQEDVKVERVPIKEPKNSEHEQK